ncbi:heme oxygenase (biliverdin-producing) [Pseudonocardia sp. GCM10023141]|uniref:biliverdin-producing heme oxygenase n=1 Tax=Pseudonocardia sp. GCM10023141 TaxID=3252653 RepID=UPI003608D7FF
MPDPTPFSQVLKSSTAEMHELAHHSVYMNALLGGRLSRDEYALLATQLWFVYDALERASDVLAGDPVAEPFVIDELRRLPGLRRDLDFLLGPGWESEVAPLPATVEYADRLHEIATSWPGGYIAHHYTRYLGDLAGGQIVRRVLQRSYGIVEDGAHFYDFGTVGNPAAFRRRYREALDGVPLGERDRVAAEAVRAFELNIAVLAQLADELDAGPERVPA